MRSAIRIAAVAAALFVSPFAAAAPCVGFHDVPADSEFCQYVDWIKNRGITQGCSPGLYCADLPVTRLQMAAFLSRMQSMLPPMVVDQLGKELGPFFHDPHLEPSVIARRGVAFGSASIRDMTLARSTIYHALPLCLGDAYMDSTPSSSRLAAMGNTPGLTAVFVAEGEPVLLSSMGSKRSLDGECLYWTLTEPAYFLRAVFVGSFKEPFQIR